MTRIFLPPEELTSNKIRITGDNARHLSLVLRVKPGESLVVFDGQGYRYECTVQNVHKKEILTVLNKKEPYSVESSLSITLAQGIARGEKMDLIVQKSTELGIQKIIPVITERSQVRNTQKTTRWRKIARSAAQQSGRDRIPEIAEPVELNQLLLTPPNLPLIKGRKKEGLLNLILSEYHSERNLKQRLTGLKDINHLTLLVGPEGGFSKEEVSAAIDKGFLEVSLGPRILRTETAPIAAISIIQYERGDMG